VCYKSPSYGFIVGFLPSFLFPKAQDYFGKVPLLSKLTLTIKVWISGRKQTTKMMIEVSDSKAMMEN
jgi:hypothetical protein